MRKLICNSVSRVLKFRRELEEKLDVKIQVRGKEIEIDGEPEDEYLGEKIIDAVNFGFNISDAISIRTEDFQFDILNIKDHTKRKDFERIRGRIIGTQRKTLKTLSQLTKCYFQVHDHWVGILGPSEKMEFAHESIISLIKGTKQSNVYSRLEKHQEKPIWDLGLKENSKK